MDNATLCELAVTAKWACAEIIGESHALYYDRNTLEHLQDLRMKWLRQALDKLTAAVEAAEAALKAEQRDAA